MAALRIAFVASEVAGFAKTGGLADVSAALPRFLHRAGHDVRLFLPLYRDIDLAEDEVHVVDFARDVPVRFGDREFRFTLRTTRLPDSELWVYLVDCPELYDRDGIYRQDGDEHLRFALLTRAAIEGCQRMAFRPDLFHAHDWHAATLPLWLRAEYAWDALFHGVPTVLTIHNIAYQGKFDARVLDDLGLARHAGMFHQKDLAGGVVNYLKTGVLYADAVTTVSTTYAREIQTPAFGEGLDDLLRRRSASVVGIVNGVDYGQWNPSTDTRIPFPYDADSLDLKERNKVVLMEDLHLEYAEGHPLLGIVSRLTPQKGLDLYPDVLPDLLMHLPVRLAVLGSGEAGYERFFQELQHRFPDRVCFYRGFHESLAHRIEAGADLFLMPSRFEPCGLNQMYSLRYGTPPVVRRTGGLADTVTHFDPSTGEGDGFVFETYDASGLRWALTAALTTYRDPSAWDRVRRNGMARDWSWDRQGAEYVRLYEAILRRD
jgi:starch synthase